MDSDWLAMAAGMAADEKRRAEKKAQQEKQEIKGQYDKWCTDHGVPAPPNSNKQAYSSSSTVGASIVGWFIAGIIILILLVLIIR